MADEKEPRAAAARALSAAENSLAGLDTEPFSPQAFDALKRSIAWFISELIEESLRISKRHRSDNVDQSHVETAAQHLLADAPSRFFRHLGTLGGIFFGAALSNLLSMLTTKSLTILSVSVTVTLAVVGAFLVALHIARD